MSLTFNAANLSNESNPYYSEQKRRRIKAVVNKFYQTNSNQKLFTNRKRKRSVKTKWTPEEVPY